MTAKLDLSQPRLMGILNVTPDSFSDGGKFINLDKALVHALAMLDQGADIIDIGGESTRPGALRVSAKEQKERTGGIIEAIASKRPDALMSIDTTSVEVAECALDAGVGMLNDISAARDDPAMLELAAKRNIPICLMHIQGTPQTMQDNPHYEDVVSEVCSFLSERVAIAIKCGVSKRNIIVDPGIGFGKTTEHNLALIANLNRIVCLLYTSPSPRDRTRSRMPSSA